MRFGNLPARPLLTAGAGLFAAVILGAIYLGIAYGLSLFPFSPEQNLPSNIQIVLDRSFAMEESFRDGTKMEAAVRAINQQILTNRVASSGNLALRQFGGSCDGDNTQLLVGFGRGNQPNVESALRGVDLAGETTFVDGIIQAIRDFGQAERPEIGHNEIMVIAGGDDACQFQDSAALIRQEIDQSGIQVNIRFIGLDVPPDQQIRFNELALAISGELPVYASSPIELEEKLTGVLKLIEAEASDPAGEGEGGSGADGQVNSTPAGTSESSANLTATPTPAVTPPPTATPEPTVMPPLTATPEPTATPPPTVTPEPTVTPPPTVTPEPTATPLPTVTPEPTTPPGGGTGGGSGGSGNPNNTTDDDDDSGSFITLINVPPFANGQEVNTDEDTPLEITLTASDLETGAADLSFAINQPPISGTLSATGSGTANWVYTPALNLDQTDSFTFTATDRGDPDDCGAPGTGCLEPQTSELATVNITVNPVNDPPTANPQQVETDEDTPLEITLTASDVETAADDLFFAIIQPPILGTLAVTGSGTASWVYTPALNENGTDSFTFTATDRGDPDDCGAPGPGCVEPQTSGPATVSITVNPVNDPPSANPQQVETDEDTPLEITLAASDLETGAADLVFAIIQPPTAGTLASTGSGNGNWVYTPESDFIGIDSFTFTATDRGDPDDCGAPGLSCAATLTSAPATVSITVNDMSLLQIIPASATVSRGLRQAFSAAGGAAPYIFAMLENNSGGSIDVRTGVYTAGFTSGVTDIVSVIDVNGNFEAAQVDVEQGGVCSEAIISFTNDLSSLKSLLEDALRVTSNPDEREAIVQTFEAGKAVIEQFLNGALQSENCSLSIQLLNLTPPDGSVLAGDSFQFNVAGDLPPYTFPPYSFSMVVNRSGGAINQNTGLYTAGPVEGVRDVIRVADTRGHVSHAIVAILPPVG